MTGGGQLASNQEEISAKGDIKSSEERRERASNRLQNDQAARAVLQDISSAGADLNKEKVGLHRGESRQAQVVASLRE